MTEMPSDDVAAVQRCEQAYNRLRDELASLPEVFAAHIVTGRYDIDMLVALHDFDDLSEFLLDKLSNVHGIRALTPAIVVDIIKYQFEVAPIAGRG